MKINTIINSLHKLHLKLKSTYLVFFSLVIVIASLASQKVMGEGVISSVSTDIKYISEEQTTEFTTNENTLENALIRQGIKLDKNDLTDPALSTRLIGGKVTAKLIPARPVLINDNGQYWVGKSAYKTTDEILKQLSITIDRADIVNTELILNPVTDNMAGQKINIKRAPVFTIFVDAKEVLVHSWKKFVSDILVEGGISLNQHDTVSPSTGSIAPTSGRIEVTRVNYADVEETIPVEYQETTQNSYEMYQGQSKVTQEGVNGSTKQTIHIVYNNGIEVSREITATVVLSSPLSKVTLIGVKPYGIDDLWPIIVDASSKYGTDPGKMARVMMCESGGNQYSGQYGQYKGLFQWDGSFYGWAAKAGYGGADIFDVYAQIHATALRAGQNGWGAWGACQNR